MVIRAIQWVKAHKAALATAAFIILLGAGLGAAFVVQMRDNKNRGWQILSNGQYVAMQGQAPEAHRYFSELEAQYNRNEIGDFGLLWHATLYAREGNWTQAIERYQALLNRQKVKPILPLATMGLARAYDATGARDKAIEEFQKFLSLYADHFATPQAYEGLARLHESKGEKDKTKEYLERLRVLYPDSVWAVRATTKLRLLAQEDNR